MSAQIDSGNVYEHLDRVTAERDRLRDIAAALEAQVAAAEALAEAEHAGGCFYRHQQGESNECNSCAAAHVTAPLWEDRDA